jgi:hypothetical protein
MVTPERPLPEKEASQNEASEVLTNLNCNSAIGF